LRILKTVKKGDSNMKTIFCLALILGAIAFLASGVRAQQCDQNALSPIRCGFYTEGYQDGANDARNNQNSDYRRYRNKLTSQYESFYRQGYDAGYGSTGGGGGYNRWSGSQRAAYDVGYNAGQNDRNRSASREASRGSYSGDLYLYFQQGYNDGFGGRQRQYDAPVGGGNYPGNPGNPGYPGPRSSSGTINWNGRVDDRMNIVIQGAMVRTDVVSGTGYGQADQNPNVLPRRAVTISANKLDGRGTVTVVQQPNRSNDFTAIVQVYDPKSGADNYRVQISWQPGYQADEPYQTGSVRWSGRVDQTANIVISGSDVQTLNVSGNGVSNVNFTINGYLAHRPGNITVRKRDGRGSVTVLQQPSSENDYTAVIQVFDPDGGADNYDLEVNW
jgi:hypothetical protein